MNPKPTADEMSLQDAFMEGQRAGNMLFGPPLNPFQDDTPEHAEWERGRSAAVAHKRERAA
jgi:hypothetical protein